VSPAPAFLATPRGRRIAAGGAIAAFAALGGTLIWLGTQAERKKGKRKGSRGAPKIRPGVERGRLLCPAEENKVPPTKGIVAGDFVVLKVISADETFGEQAWGHVLSVSPAKDQIQVEIVTSLVPSGLRPLETDRHGFHVGEKIKIDRACVYDVLRRQSDQYEILCGVMLPGDGPAKAALDVKPGDFVTVVVGNKPLTSNGVAGKAWQEPLKVSITSDGPSGYILGGVIWEQPKKTEQHGLKTFDKLEFTRDCILEA